MTSPYQPSLETARFAPACVCQVAARVVWLRKLIDSADSPFNHEARLALRPFIAGLPFEEELLSGNMDKVDAAVKAIGETFQGEFLDTKLAESNVNLRELP